MEDNYISFAFFLSFTFVYITPIKSMEYTPFVIKNLQRFQNKTFCTVAGSFILLEFIKVYIGVEQCHDNMILKNSFLVQVLY